MITFDSFYNNKAIELVKWYCKENNRIKAIKIFKSACNMEYNYRMNRWNRVNVEFINLKPRSVNMIRVIMSDYIPPKKIEKENK